MNIEEVAATDPGAIIKQPVDIERGLDDQLALQIAQRMGFHEHNVKQAAETIQHLYQVFLDTDATLLEINPLGEVAQDGSVVCVDCKISVDKNARFRQRELFGWRDPKQEDPLEVRAADAGLNYIRLDGNIGCMGEWMTSLLCLK